MSYTSGIVAATLAAAVVSMICSGGRHEKLCTSVCCAFIALSVLFPLRSAFASGGTDDIGTEVAHLREAGNAKVVEACREELELRVGKAIEEKYPGAEVTKVVISYNDEDIRNITVTGCRLALDGADAEDVGRYVSELLCCDSVSVEISGGDKNGDRKGS